ncbi:hypothetical protein [Falsirhodobacter sp. alg1]|uniref:hypothetical protein n=1 Tax=Falsirhodobacter sp. alg1 TaxID=1472418 RepID=UPI0005EEE5BF|nr:hypothetical protein [Falsirhodobacter sp. alg1]
MRILSAQIEHARYARDFGQVEAMVTLLVKDEHRPVPYEVRIRTAEPTQGENLRKRLLDSASNLYRARIDVAPERQRFDRAA